MVLPAAKRQLAALTKLASELWPGHPEEELRGEFAELLQRKDARCFLFYDRGLPVGFAQCQLRFDYVEGTSSSPVGYLEGIFVKPEHRRKGYGKELLRACESWASAQGCREFASDCEIGNRDSDLFHRGAGFREANRIICFTKTL